MKTVFDSLTLRAVTLELRQTLSGAQIQKIRQPDATTILMRMYNRGASHWLLLCTHPALFRAHLTTREYVNPSEPPPFCMALRKYLEGGRVQDIGQAGPDRVLRIDVQTTWGSLELVAELMGRHSNLMLLNADNMIIEANRRAGPGRGNRVVLPGRPYPALPAIAGVSLWDAAADELDSEWLRAPQPPTSEWLISTFAGMSPSLAERVLASDEPRSTLNDIARTIREGKPPEFLLNGHPTVSEALDTFYAGRQDDDRKAELLRTINAALSREEKTLHNRREDLRRIEENAALADGWRIAGELLQANRHAVEKGVETVSLPNYYEPDTRSMEIRLEPRLSPGENAEAYFLRSRKAKAAFVRLPEMTAELDRLDKTLEEKRRVVATASTSELEALRTQLTVTSSRSTHVKAETVYPPGVRIRRLVSEEGFPIWIGENATGNDYLTTRASDPNDIWLHVRAAASAHGIIRTNKHPERVPFATLRKAAELVAAKSEAKGSGVIAVDYTLRRYVRKPRGAAPGRVTYTNEKTIEVTPDR